MNKTVLSDFKAFREKWENINNIPRVRGLRNTKKIFFFFVFNFQKRNKNYFVKNCFKTINEKISDRCYGLLVYF